MLRSESSSQRARVSSSPALHSHWMFQSRLMPRRGRLAGAEGECEKNTPYIEECHRCLSLPFLLTSPGAWRSSSFPEQVAVAGHTSTSVQRALGNSENICSLPDGDGRDSATH